MVSPGLPRILLLEGANLNLLGRRERHLYGSETAEEIHKRLREHARGRAELEFFQSNHEGALVDRIQAVLDRKPVEGMILNLGAYTHTSIAIRDALLAVPVPFIEVHLSNLYRREEYRRFSYVSDLALGVIIGLGPLGYLLALDALLEHLSRKEKKTGERKKR
jgi:3-dehydroquinate dehydratase-2